MRAPALFGLKTEELRLYAPLTPEVTALIDLRTRRDQVQKMLLAKTNRLEHVRHASVTRSLKEHIAISRKALAALEAQIAAHLAASEMLTRKARLMRTLKGIGQTTARAGGLAEYARAGTLGRAAWPCVILMSRAANPSFQAISRQAEPPYAKRFTCLFP